MRAATFTLLSTDAQLLSLGMTAASFLGTSAADSPEMRPWAIIKWGQSTPAFGLTGETALEVWYYDEPGSYVRINKLIERTKSLLQDAVHVQGSDGDELTAARWAGDSPELYDDVFKCITRYTSFTVV